MEISSLSDMVMEFFEERETKEWPETFLANNGRDDDGDDDDEHEDQQQRKAFWEEQNQLLQVGVISSNTLTSFLVCVLKVFVLMPCRKPCPGAARWRLG